MKNKCVIDVFDFGDDEREETPSPSLNDRFEIRDRREESKSEKLYAVRAERRRMWGFFDGEIDKFALNLVIKNALDINKGVKVKQTRFN